MQPFTLKWIISKQDDGKLIRQFLKEQEISKAALIDIKFSGGSITVNSELVTVRYALQEGEVLQIVFPLEKPSDGLKKENIPLDIVFEDDFIIVINKPSNMSTIPSREHPVGSLANALLHYYEQTNIYSTIHIVNRLDRDTSGLLLVAKHRFIHHLLSKQQKMSSIKRRYEAFVHGHLPSKVDTINAPIGRKDDSIIEREVRVNDGQTAVTHYRVLEEFEEYSHVSLQLETGRTHQIRVHLAHIGHPLVGDDLYGGTRNVINRQALHSCELSFIHPITQEQLTFSVRLPNDMNKISRKKD